MTDTIFLQISFLFGLATIVAFLSKLLRQPFMIAYIVAGIAAGPLLLNIIYKDDVLYKTFSEIGVILLLFVIGLSLNFNFLKKIGKVSLIVGIGQVLFTGLVGIFLLKFLGFSQLAAIYLAIATTFSSTIIITKLLSDKKDTESVYGRHTIGLMLVQDIIAIIILILLNSVKDFSSLAGSIGVLTIKGVALVGVVYLLSRYLLPKILDYIASSNEFLFLFTVAWCFGIANLIYYFGFSLEIGAIFAGLSLSSSVYQTEISSRIKPLRDFFLIVFFIILGTGMNFSNLNQALVPSFILSAFILLGKPFILYYLFRWFKFTRRNSLLAGLSAAQVSEFGFVLLLRGEQLGQAGNLELSVFTLVAIATIFVSSYLITYNEQIYRFLLPLFNLLGKDRYQQLEKEIPIYEVWVIGYHRIGSKICESLKEKGTTFAVIDYNPEVIKSLHKKNIPAYFGDVGDIEFLAELPLNKTKHIISTIPELDDQATLIRHVRSLNSKVFIIANCSQLEHIDSLYGVGANYVMMPHLLGGGWISELLKNKQLNHRLFQKLKKEQYQELWSSQASEL